MASETFLSKANTIFALDLFKTVSEGNNTGNIFCSSFSISAALAMTRLGARGDTKAQISQFFEPRDDGDNVDVSFAQLLKELKKPSALCSLSIANRLYGEKTCEFKQDFVLDTEKYYGAPLEAVDFNNKPEESRININKWVEAQTQDKIKDLLPPGAVDDSTVLVLVNALYFKGKWKTPFEEWDTHDADFHLNKNDKKSVKMMHQTDDFNISSNEVCQVLEMPYEGGELSMIIMLPHRIEDDTTGLEKLERELTFDKFKQWTGRNVMQMKAVKLSLPRFKMEESYDLKKVLMSLGMVDAFDASKSNFSGMSEVKPLFLSKAVHKAFVEVNEEGTEAAAATGFRVQFLSLTVYHSFETFNADHPFLLFIRHNPSNSVLFAGRFSSPE